jgi:hypothetical protein
MLKESVPLPPLPTDQSMQYRRVIADPAPTCTTCSPGLYAALAISPACNDG